jgi:hypothetical protein
MRQILVAQRNKERTDAVEVERVERDRMLEATERERVVGVAKVEKENEIEWEAEFKMNSKEYSANFSNEGDWKETEIEIEESEIPEDIKEVLDKNYKDYEIEEAELAETADGKFYEFEIEMGKQEFTLVIDSKGNLIKKSEEDESNDKD